jgi:hypothetical protein
MQGDYQLVMLNGGESAKQVLKLITCCTYKPSSLALGSLGYLLWSSGLFDNRPTRCLEFLYRSDVGSHPVHLDMESRKHL